MRQLIKLISPRITNLSQNHKPIGYLSSTQLSEASEYLESPSEIHIIMVSCSHGTL